MPRRRHSGGAWPGQWLINMAMKKHAALSAARSSVQWRALRPPMFYAAFNRRGRFSSTMVAAAVFEIGM